MKHRAKRDVSDLMVERQVSIVPAPSDSKPTIIIRKINMTPSNQIQSLKTHYESLDQMIEDYRLDPIEYSNCLNVLIRLSEEIRKNEIIQKYGNGSK